MKCYRACDVVNFTRHLKRYSGQLTGMTGGVMSRGKSRMARDRISSPPESTRNNYHALPALTLPVVPDHLSKEH